MTGTSVPSRSVTAGRALPADIAHGGACARQWRATAPCWSVSRPGRCSRRSSSCIACVRDVRPGGRCLAPVGHHHGRRHPDGAVTTTSGTAERGRPAVRSGRGGRGARRPIGDGRTAPVGQCPRRPGHRPARGGDADPSGQHRHEPARSGQSARSHLRPAPVGGDGRASTPWTGRGARPRRSVRSSCLDTWQRRPSSPRGPDRGSDRAGSGPRRRVARRSVRPRSTWPGGGGR